MEMIGRTSRRKLLVTGPLMAMGVTGIVPWRVSAQDVIATVLFGMRRIRMVLSGVAPRLLLCLLAASIAPARARAATLAYVVNHTSDDVSVIDTASNVVVATVAVGGAPIGIAIAPNGARAYITNQSTNTISVIDTFLNVVVDTIATGRGPNGIAVTPDVSRLYVAMAGNTVSAIDISVNPPVTTTVTVGTNPYAIAVSPDGKLVYVTNIYANTVSVIDTTNNTVGTTISVGEFPNSVAFSPTGARAYVTNAGTDSVSVIDTANSAVVATIGVERSPQGVAVTPDGKRLYVTNAGPSTVSVIDTAGNIVTATIQLHFPPRSETPVGIAVTPDGSRVYVTSYGPFGTNMPNAVLVIDSNANTLLGTITVERNPIAVAITVTRSPNQPPVAVAGPAQTVPCISPSGAVMHLDGSGSFDPDGDPLTFHWDVPAGITLDDPSSSNPTGGFPIGNTLVTLTVADGKGGIDSDDVLITVVDRTPPQVFCTTDIAALWPPNHRMVEVFVSVRATDACTAPDKLLLVYALVSSNEPDNGLGDGDTPGDVEGQDGFTRPVDVTRNLVFNPTTASFEGIIHLRTERAGNGKGRAYTIQVAVTDASKNVGIASCVVVVPHDQQKK